MAWYEEHGPNAAYARTHTFQLLNTHYSFDVHEKDAINDILLKHIPDSKADFGSYRGYATFGLEDNIMEAIRADIDNRRNAMSIIKEKLPPLVRHFLYKMDGPIMRRTAQTTLVGKDI